ncbi:MAG: universal stress protein, partial [Usitatibacter sp.]
MYKKILLAYDGSETGQRALLESKVVADWGQAEIVLIAVMPPPAAFIGGEGGVYDAGLEEEERREFKAILEDGVKRL